jgi:hypothetical protein
MQYATWTISMLSPTGSVTLLPHSKGLAFATYVMCYPPGFSAAQVGALSVFVSNSALEAPRLVGNSTNVSYVGALTCASKCVISRNELLIGENFKHQVIQCVCFTISAATAGEVISIMMQSYDEIGNQVDILPELQFLLFEHNRVTRTGSSLCHINIETTIFSSFKRTSYASASVVFVLNVTEPVDLQGALLQPGGLSMEIFVGPHFNVLPLHLGSATSEYSAIDLNFGNGQFDFDIAQYQSNISTILWRGFLIPRCTEIHKFYLSSNGCATVHISGILVFSCSDAVRTSLMLRANELHAVEVSYFISIAKPSLVLFWESLSQPKEIIPSGCW